ncbi:hypothetical protein A3F08_00770 [Candidatus Berkelbacteria bacterium RIFCSPHIGHO2_12_FULL_36_9]|uniref:Uncharacterized protein n=1 Tax=Candidatus Berkelbacteria bacterium RIFCSPHIGHO2_12_FULL_36_9 TaxID=1797469 RepID=A0A1F5EJH6_9BACT|nr:MAG: hypothetical protein A3F08_00770 [Candidatus Berkelbacteria bacterium RIFCSPHIGHO2_12_FULL_36_9]
MKRYNWLKSNLGLPVLIPIIINIVGLFILPESNISWTIYIYFYLPALIISLISVICAILFFKEQTILSKIFLVLGIIYMIFIFIPYTTSSLEVSAFL